MRAIVVGAGGQLGQALLQAFQGTGDVRGLTHQALDVADRKAVVNAFQHATVDVVINAAAMTNVDQCELDSDKAFAVNALAVRWLAEACAARGATLVQISTDYVFAGDQDAPYGEWDQTGPIQAYGRSKLAGEVEALFGCQRCLVVRTSWLYGGSEKGFVQAVLRQLRGSETLTVVSDQRGSPSYTRDVAEAVVTLVQNGVSGVTHVTNAGSCSRYELAQEISHCLGRIGTVKPVLTQDMPALAARRPRNTALQSQVCPALGVALRPWQDAIDEFVRGQS